MGNVSAAANIVIHIDNPSIIPGTFVSGRVYLNVNHEKVDSEAIMIRLTGGEYTCVKWSSGSGEHRHHHVRNSTALFLDLAYPLASLQPGTFFQKGQYEFPFRFCLPPGILPSMGASIPGSEGGHCSVTYTMEAKLHRKGWFKWDVHQRQELWVLGQPVHHLPNYATYLPPVEYPLTFCCCFDRGNVRLGISTEKSLLAAGEEFAVNYVIQNNSTSRIKALEIEVFEDVIWRAQSEARSLRSTLYHRRLNEKDIETDLSPLDATPSHDVGGRSYVITNPEVLMKLKSILDSKTYNCRAAVGANARTTMDGRLIDVEHSLKLRIATPFGTSDPEIATRLTIHRYGIQVAPYAVPSFNPAGDQRMMMNQAQPQYQPQQGYPQQQQQYQQIPQYQQAPSQQQQTRPPELPQNWHAQVAPAAEIPMPFYVPPNIVHSEDAPAVGDYSQPPPQLHYQGVESLFIALANSYSPVEEFKRWCSVNRCDDLSPQDFGRMYHTVKNLILQLSLTEEIVVARSQISCAHIAEAVFYTNDQIRVDVAKRLLAKCFDKGNAYLIKDRVSPFQWICIEPLFSS